MQPFLVDFVFVGDWVWVGVVGEVWSDGGVVVVLGCVGLGGHCSQDVS